MRWRVRQAKTATVRQALRACTDEVLVQVPAKSPRVLGELDLELRDVRPKVWRRLLVPLEVDLSRPHVMLLSGTGWDGGHVHDFTPAYHLYGATEPGRELPDDLMPEEDVPVSQALDRHKSFPYRLFATVSRSSTDEAGHLQSWAAQSFLASFARMSGRSSGQNSLPPSTRRMPRDPGNVSSSQCAHFTGKRASDVPHTIRAGLGNLRSAASMANSGLGSSAAR